LLITDTNIFALLKPQLEDITVHFFPSVCRSQTNGIITLIANERENCDKLGTYYKKEIKYANDASMRVKSNYEDDVI